MTATNSPSMTTPTVVVIAQNCRLIDVDLLNKMSWWSKQVVQSQMETYPLGGEAGLLPDRVELGIGVSVPGLILSNGIPLGRSVV